MDLFAPAHLGAQVAFAQRAPIYKAPVVTRVGKAETSGKTGAETRQLSQNAENSAAARDLNAMKQAHKDPDRPAGPPPSFEVSLLEVEQDLKNVIARMEISRMHNEDADAVKAGDMVSIYSEVNGRVGKTAPRSEEANTAIDTKAVSGTGRQEPGQGKLR